MNKKYLWLFEYFFCVILLVLILLVYVHVNRFDIHLPLSYTGDGLSSLQLVKSIVDTGWYLTNPYIGFPCGYNFNDYPMADGTHMILLWLLAHVVSHNYVVVANSFYLLSFFTAVFTAFFVLRFLGLRYPLALAASLLFAFLPDHFLRNESHFFLASYFSVPLWSLFAIKILTGERLLLSKNKFLDAGIKALILTIIASSGIYYTFFGCFFVFVALLMRYVLFRNEGINRSAIKILLVAVLVVGMNLAPSVFYHLTHGANPAVAERSVGDAEVLGLTLTQTILPEAGDRWSVLAHLRAKYDRTLPPILNNENAWTSLGIVGVVGLFILLGGLFCQRRVAAHPVLYAVTKLNFAGILLATVGGFGVLFALLLSPEIRGYNRISVYLGFFALYAVFYIVQVYLERRKSSLFVYSVSAFLLLNLGLLDQVSPDYAQPSYYTSGISVSEAFLSDQVFVAAIEKLLPPGSAVFQLPYTAFPEDTVHDNKFGNYSLERGYLHSHDLRWSFAAMRGRQVANWQAAVTALPTAAMLKQLVFAGYSGIYIDRNSYADHGQFIENNLRALLKEAPMVSPAGDLSFFNLLSYQKVLMAQYTPSQWRMQLVQTQIALAMDVHYGVCNLAPEMGCTKKENTVLIYNNAAFSPWVTLSFQAQGSVPAPKALWIKWPGQRYYMISSINSLKWSHYERVVQLKLGRNLLILKTDSPPVHIPGHYHPIYFRLDGIVLQGMSS